MTNYASFAKFYDQTMGDKSDKVAFLRQLLKENAPQAQTVLELACGTGTILEGLASDYSVTGVDLSPEMVEIAKNKLPDGDIRVGDMTKCELGRTFDVVLCVYDSINHLQTWEQWCALFANAHQHVADDGVFIFDFNTLERLQQLADSPSFCHEVGDDYMFMKIYAEDDRFNWDIRIFEQQVDGRFVLHKDLIVEISFPVDQVTDEVTKQFSIEKIVDAKNTERSNPQWRPFVVCRKRRELARSSQQ